ncbi:hypothetical protein MD588_24080 [Photobacterium sp. SDRW27]|uniref:hypothetical protein n=1 Tax=Photobacterium obscurum TaxID=2829490 RepID=UPI0022439650|nr:hypothetical protein [Photobacterium obscurum]MCW8331883.1 hypothetical protein [Photobacterium obscurum]
MKIFDIERDKLAFNFEYNTEETDTLHRMLNGASNIGVDDLRRVSLWKSNRILSVDDKTLTALNNLGAQENVELESPFVKEVIERLVLSQGIGFPLASTILKFINPDVFPIIDVRAYRALTGKKPYYSTYSYDSYIKYAQDLTEIAKTLHLPLRDIDEQLYCFDKANNGKI